MSKILITGGAGFVGSYLSEYFKKDESNKVDRSSRTNGQGDIVLDLTNRDSVGDVLFNYDKIFHLAAQASVRNSFEDSFKTMRDNILSTLNLLELLKGKKIKLVIAGSSETYKWANSVLTEKSSLDAKSPFAISKLTIDYFVRTMAKPLDINVTLLRLFSHIGPGQSEHFALSNWAKQIAEIKLDRRTPTVKVGNIDIYRDYTDVRDVCYAYDLVSNCEEQGEVYNVCSGTTYKLETLLHMLLEIAEVNAEIMIDKDRVREIDAGFIRGSHKKIKERFGWMPKIPIEKSLRDLYNYWYGILKSDVKRSG